MNWSTTWPLRMAKTAGMDCTAKVWAIRGLSSTLTLASSTAPPVSATAFSSIGPSVLHGPHQGAHRSTTTGTVALRASTSSWKVWSVTSIGHDANGCSRTRSDGPSVGRRLGRGPGQDLGPAGRAPGV